MTEDLEDVRAPKIGGVLPHDDYIRVLYSIAKSLKRIADVIELAGTIPIIDMSDLGE